MMMHVALVAEILATFFCIHCIYGKKVTFDVKTIGAILSILVTLEIINKYQLDGVYSFIVYIIFLIYCKAKFNSSFVETLISLVLCMIVLTSVQFVCLLTVSMTGIEMEYVRDAVSNTMLLIASVVLFPNMKMNKLQKSLYRNSKFVLVLSGFMCLIVIIVLLFGKVFNEIQVEYFVLVIPAIFLLLYSIFMWFTAQSEAERIETELLQTEEKSKDYESLLMKVRLRQHEFKNHLAAIFSAHYTYKTYENLVRAQEEYCKKIVNENRYNNLLLLGNKIIVGYLYGKFQEAEDDGITIAYKINTKIDTISIPAYYVIEMLGILFDNAMEALKGAAKKEISFEISELNHTYIFLIQNPYRYVTYDELLEWFKLGKSDKGNERGLGLYHLKCLCEEWHCEIECRNVEIDQNNWISFRLMIGMADSK